MFNPLYGLQIIVDDNATLIPARVQIRFPRSRKKRIRRKWQKNPKNWKTTWIDRGPIAVGPIVLVSSRHYALLRARVAVDVVAERDGLRVRAHLVP
jgi:hypothetical protein